jgi:hypothetical protein
VVETHMVRGAGGARSTARPCMAMHGQAVLPWRPACSLFEAAGGHTSTPRHAMLPPVAGHHPSTQVPLSVSAIPEAGVSCSLQGESLLQPLAAALQAPGSTASLGAEASGGSPHRQAAAGRAHKSRRANGGWGTKAGAARQLARPHATINAALSLPCTLPHSSLRSFTGTAPSMALKQRCLPAATRRSSRASSSRATRHHVAGAVPRLAAGTCQQRPACRRGSSTRQARAALVPRPPGGGGGAALSAVARVATGPAADRQAHAGRERQRWRPQAARPLVGVQGGAATGNCGSDVLLSGPAAAVVCVVSAACTTVVVTANCTPPSRMRPGAPCASW